MKRLYHLSLASPNLSSFNRSGIDPSISSNSSSQAAHHLMRASARENPKSASLSAQQHISKIPEKLKCVLFLSHFLFLFDNNSSFSDRRRISQQSSVFLLFFSFLISDLEKHHRLSHYLQIAIQVRFESIRVNIIIIHQQSSKRQFSMKTTIDRHDLERLRILIEEKKRNPTKETLFFFLLFFLLIYTCHSHLQRLTPTVMLHEMLLFCLFVICCYCYRTHDNVFSSTLILLVVFLSLFL